MATVLRRKTPSPVVSAVVVRRAKPNPAPQPAHPVIVIHPEPSPKQKLEEFVEKRRLLTQENEWVATIKRYKDKVKNPKSAIRAKCVECSGGSLKEVAECRVSKCALYPFRMGENPFHKKTLERLARGAGEDPSEQDDDESGD